MSRRTKGEGIGIIEIVLNVESLRDQTGRGCLDELIRRRGKRVHDLRVCLRLGLSLGLGYLR